LGIAPSDLSVPAVIAMSEDFNDSMELVDSKELATLRSQAKELAEALRKTVAAVQGLDLESNYYVDGTRHPFQKVALVTAGHDGERALLKYRESKR